MVNTEPKNAPANMFGIRRIMFAVEENEEVLARLQSYGSELIGKLRKYPSALLRRGPEGVIVALVEQIG
ncbi:VOC family protein [Leptospira borgpetersenii]|uniref:Glyoxalase-like domain protein n=2 Tax=Leptospira borgpetersenii TaxID=174 RepID=A0A0E3B604_LEPBO|nr:hypothetical protein [Leptospira borgpetersenii]ANH01338.2 Uncharacterized protein LB4E_2047 [Leptospira borgpetersenii str. 4E]EKR01397.1 hypothetical protein LEP1GSC121_2831 [Leptospira borgpetersenii serovar Castellonis str. 200801910]EMO07596.1 hypothetical protein LEP1GSC137_0015 [Leptospira borgpetersenii str. Noumea 25]ALO26814.1 hypothetical protein LBBP_02585 [Leptospira borgpetersenii serovar Ballum]KGE23081.1 hypothetical protein IQ66_13475 [Leptospira borgpetersenii serovar Ball